MELTLGRFHSELRPVCLYYLLNKYSLDISMQLGAYVKKQRPMFHGVYILLCGGGGEGQTKKKE